MDAALPAMPTVKSSVIACDSRSFGAIMTLESIPGGGGDRGIGGWTATGDARKMLALTRSRPCP